MRGENHSHQGQLRLEWMRRVTPCHPIVLTSHLVPQIYNMTNFVLKKYSTARSSSQMSDEELPPRALGQLRFTLHMHLHGMPHRFRIRPNLPSHSDPKRSCPQGESYHSRSSVEVNNPTTHTGSSPPHANPQGDWRHCKGLDVRFFDDDLFFNPFSPLDFKDETQLPKVKPTGIPSFGAAFAEVRPREEDEGTTDVKDSFHQGIPGPGLYGTSATPYLDPKSLTETQALMTVPHWDGKGEAGVEWKESYLVWDNDVGRALGDAVRRRVLRAAIPKDLANSFGKRIDRRRRGYAALEKLVFDEVDRRANPDVISDKWKALELPAKPTALDAAGFMDDWLYYGSQVKGGVTHQGARDQFLDALGPRQENFIYKLYLEERRKGKEHNYLEIFQVLMTELMARDAAHNKQDHWRRRNHQGHGRVQQIQGSESGEGIPVASLPTEFEPDEAQVLALMDKKRTSHVIVAAALDTWSRIAGLNTLSSFLRV